MLANDKPQTFRMQILTAENELLINASSPS